MSSPAGCPASTCPASRSPAIPARCARSSCCRRAEPAMEIRSPLSGSVVAITVEPGRIVRAGAVLAIVESMKMEHEVRAEGDGEVASVRVGPGDVVAEGEILLTLQRAVDKPVAAGGAPAGSPVVAAEAGPAVRDDLLEL